MALARFWKQANKHYRNMQIVLTLLTLNFLIPSLSYMFTPETALAQFEQLGRALGGGDYPISEVSQLWRVLAAGNVFTLAWICLLLQINIRRFQPVIPVFVVLKGFSALGFLYVYLTALAYPVFLAAFLWDGLAVFLVVFFGGRAHRAVTSQGEEGLVPALRWKAAP